MSSATEAHAGVLTQWGDMEAVAGEQRALVTSMEELVTLERTKQEQLVEEVARREDTITQLQTKLSCGEEELAALQERLHEVEEEKEGVDQELEQARIGREEVEESLVDTQGLVEAMEDKLQEADRRHRQEVKEQHFKLQKMESQKEQVVGERTSLLEMNTALSTQVSDSLANIHELQCREVELCKEVALLRGFMEASQEEGERDRVRMMQAEDEILSLQAEIEAVLVEREDAGKTAGHWAETAHTARQQVFGVPKCEYVDMYIYLLGAGPGVCQERPGRPAGHPQVRLQRRRGRAR